MTDSARAAGAPATHGIAANGHLQRLVRCPACRTPLAWSETSAACQACSREYPITDGIPVLLLDVRAADEDELVHHKSEQAAFFDRDELAEFEITRPRGTPRLHAWLLAEKLRRSVAAVPSEKRTTALAVCGGSGMDAEFLAREGARVISADLSLGAARRATERARRHGVSLLSIVADVEHLPFADRAVDLVYVHDGLHHLARPAVGLTEMARVAAHAISVTEPARSVATRLAIRLGLALEREEAGNLVARLRLQEVMALARSNGFRVVCAGRYMMYYRHRPGWPCRVLSMPGLFGVTRNLWRMADGLAGRLGNKLTVQAVREPV